MFARKLGLIFLVYSSLLASAARAEAWPDMAEFVPKCVLIVHCRTEKVDERSLYKVLDVWKGEYSPLAFVKQPPTGYIDTAMGVGPDDVAGGHEVILFYAGHNQPPGKIERPDMALVVRDGRVTYPPTGEHGDVRDYSIEEFKRRVTGAAAATADGGRPGDTQPDLAGSWRVFLPAGFERRVTLTRVGENRYRFEPGLNFSGVYEVQGDRLTMVEPREPRLAGFEWRIRSRWMLSLVGQAPGTGADYLGAVLFRPRPQPELEVQD